MKKLLILLILLFALPSYAQQCSEETPCPELARLSPAMMGSVPVASGPACGVTLILGTDANLSTTANVGAGRWGAYRYPALSSASVGCIKLYVNSCGAAGNEDMGVVLFDNAANGAGDTDDMPNAVLGYNYNAAWPCATGVQEFILNTTVSLTADTLYWIGVYGTNDAIVYEMDNDGTPPTTEYRGTSTGKVYNAPPATGDWAALTDRIVSYSAW